MKFARIPKQDPDINLIPMIDVLLVIIIFLMLTTTYSKFAELQINLPSAAAEKQFERLNEINVVISATGQYLLQRKPIQFRDVASLAQQLRSAGAGLKDPIIVIKWKEVYENLENATDRCEDVANIIEGVILEHA